jgi:hypothetical protein
MPQDATSSKRSLNEHASASQMRVSLWSVLLPAVAATTAISGTYAQRVVALKDELWGQGYDPSSFPPGPAPGQGTVVSLGLNILQIESIDVPNGLMVLHAWVRQSWIDPRLAWHGHPTFGDIEYITAEGMKPVLPYGHKAAQPTPRSSVLICSCGLSVCLPPSAVGQNIAFGCPTPSFTMAPPRARPAIELGTLRSTCCGGCASVPCSILRSSSLYDAPFKEAMIYPDGSIFWSRPSRLKVLCTFSGLEDFPNDVMTCSLKFGQWNLDDRFQNLTLRPTTLSGGVLDGAVTAENMDPVNFLEYEIAGVQVSRSEDRWVCCPGAWPYVIFDFKLRRFVKYYNWKVSSRALVANAGSSSQPVNPQQPGSLPSPCGAQVVTVNALLTYLSFGVFFTHPMAINRQHFSVTLLLPTSTWLITSPWLTTSPAAPGDASAYDCHV